VLELCRDAATGSGESELPEHGISSGDIVVVAEQPTGSARKREVRELEKKGVRGVVVRVAKAALRVALDEGKEESGGGLDGRVWVVKLADEVTYKRFAIRDSTSFLRKIAGS